MRKNRIKSACYILVAIALLVVVSSAPALAASSCPEIKPKVMVKSLTKKTKKHHNQSAFNLTTLHNDDPRKIQGTTLGLHISPFYMTAEYLFKETDVGARTCVSLSGIKVKFYTQPVLLVASNFPKKSCEFKAVYAHEKGHDRILRGVQRKYSLKAKKDMTKFIRRFGGATSVSKDRVHVIQGRIEEQINRKMDQIVLEAGNVVNNRQSAHDSPTEYRRVSDMCDGWDRQLNGE